MPSHHTPLHQAAAEAVAAATGVLATDLKVEAPPRAEMGDLAVGCFAIAKAQGKNPAQVAQEVAAKFAPTDLLASATAAGPFVNFKANRQATLRWVVDATLQGKLLPREHGAGKTITIDYGSPNISKHLAYHHIRGTTIGHALAQSFRALGYNVVGINFLGDWGTTHGMVIAAYYDQLSGKKLTVDEIQNLSVTVEQLNQLYVAFRAKYKDTTVAEDRGRAYLKMLEDGDAEVTALWQKFRDVSWAEFEEVYKVLDIEYDDLNGESFFWKDGERIAAELEKRGLLVESEGAKVVELEGEKTPILLLTKDGTTLYATRDVAAAEYREKTYHPTRSLYVVDRGQATHFRQLFKLLAKTGHGWASRLQHVPYGLVRVGGKKTGTRLGNVVLMREVFTIAEQEVRARIAEVNPNLPPDVVDKVAPQVGIGAVIFANLAPQRDKDIDFELDKAVSLDGDSGPYLQYSHARCASIGRKANETVTSIDGVDFAKLSHDAEWAVAKKLLEFPEIVVRSTDNAEPHVIAHYLLDLAGEFSRWYTLGNADATLRVLVDDADVRRARLALVAAVQATLREGLSLLGMAAPDQM
ncbi:MAG: arginine--tRNA ligase [Kofleriaceae bacterium]|nr:arginine--tRNA ligase [Kofleriaceae bacterium]